MRERCSPKNALRHGRKGFTGLHFRVFVSMWERLMTLGKVSAITRTYRHKSKALSSICWLFLEQQLDCLCEWAHSPLVMVAFSLLLCSLQCLKKTYTTFTVLWGLNIMSLTCFGQNRTKVKHQRTPYNPAKLVECLIWVPTSLDNNKPLLAPISSSTGCANLSMALSSDSGSDTGTQT